MSELYNVYPLFEAYRGSLLSNWLHILANRRYVQLVAYRTVYSGQPLKISPRKILILSCHLTIHQALIYSDIMADIIAKTIEGSRAVLLILKGVNFRKKLTNKSLYQYLHKRVLKCLKDSFPDHRPHAV